MSISNESVNKMLDHISKQKKIIDFQKKRLKNAEQILRKISLYDYIESGQYIEEVDIFVEESSEYFNYKRKKGKEDGKIKG